LFVMGSFGGGFLVGTEYGKWIGWTTFALFIAVGIMLHMFARKMQKSK